MKKDFKNVTVQPVAGVHPTQQLTSLPGHALMQMHQSYCSGTTRKGTSCLVSLSLHLGALALMLLSGTSNSSEATRYTVSYLSPDSSSAVSDTARQPIARDPARGLQPDIPLGPLTQSSTTRQVGDDVSIRRMFTAHPGLEASIEKYAVKHADPTELYTHTFAKGEANQSTYHDFFMAYLSAYVKLSNEKEFFAALDADERARYSMFLLFRINRDGGLFVSPMPIPLVAGVDDVTFSIVTSHYRAMFKKFPKHFVPPSTVHASQYIVMPAIKIQRSTEDERTPVTIPSEETIYALRGAQVRIMGSTQ